LAAAELEQVTGLLELLEMVVILFSPALLQLAAVLAVALQLMATMDKLAVLAAAAMAMQAPPQVLVLHHKVMQVAQVLTMALLVAAALVRLQAAAARRLHQMVLLVLHLQ
jgi:hypothetical protein